MSALGAETTLNLPACPEIGNRAVEAIHAAYDGYHRGFEEITRRARERFEQRDWLGAQTDATERLALYRTHVDGAVADVHDILQDSVMERTLWAAMRARHAVGAHRRPDAELAQTFFNSVTRRVFSTVGVDSAIEYLDPFIPPPDPATPPLFDRERVEAVDPGVVRRVLRRFPWSVPWASLERDAAAVSRLITDTLDALPSRGPIELDVLRPVFYRNKGAYLVGRVRVGDVTLPLVLPLLRAERGIVVDAVLMTPNEASVVFGFSWSYFRVDVPRPRELVDFLTSIMPFKRIDELYNGIGYNKHGKTELFRNLMAYLQDPEARFAFAEGDEGMVMAVFTLPAFNLVFKIIKDSFGAPKNTTRQAVMDKYHFVFVRDRVGRLADAQEFEHLEFDAARFSDALKRELTAVAGETVRFHGDTVVIGHLYTERRLRPLDVYLRENKSTAAHEAIVEYGQVLRDLAATNIFPGDMLLKNFGVTRHGRLIFYDYDELCLLTDCNFRTLPTPKTDLEEVSAEPWFYVGERDIFPEEFRSFLGLRRELLQTFLAYHGELLQVDFWHRMQNLHHRGEVVDIYPYKQSRRLREHDEELRR